jgi:hypothetical protein
MFQKAGFPLKRDLTAFEMSELCKTHAISFPDVLPGDLLFYGKPKVFHVTICLRLWKNPAYKFLIGACSGDLNTRDEAGAWTRGAGVKVMPGEYWKDQFVFASNPFKCLPV